MASSGSDNDSDTSGNDSSDSDSNDNDSSDSGSNDNDTSDNDSSDSDSNDNDSSDSDSSEIDSSVEMSPHLCVPDSVQEGGGQPPVVGRHQGQHLVSLLLLPLGVHIVRHPVLYFSHPEVWV